ncbi:hypothetical protein BBJ28_00005967 [Nothophytophthora sp. Chile5]|nr:hypothetical protein BBJ28_00005967 [Nothophytophthora sp. Chile5]
MESTPLSPSAVPSSTGGGDTVIAQYLATKVSWWASYPRILIVTPTTMSTYSPETFQCTNQWEIEDIEAVEIAPARNQVRHPPLPICCISLSLHLLKCDVSNVYCKSFQHIQFVLRLEKSRFRSAKLRFTCSARGHLLSLLARLRRQVHSQSLRYQVSTARRLYYRCIEKFANAAHKLLLLQVTVSSLIFLDDCGRRVQTLPFVYLRKVAFSSAHPEGLVLATAFHERFFLCVERHECLNEIVAAAKAAGVSLFKTASPLTAVELRQHNRAILDRPSVIRFDVKKARTNSGNGDAAPGSDGSDAAKRAFKKIQLILQGDALVELHRSMRTVIARPYSALLAIVRPDWDPRTLVLEFKQEDMLVLDVDGRDQLITLLLLVCREAGQHNVILTSSGLNYCRFYHPHAADNALEKESSAAGESMETFLLRRITQTDVRQEDGGAGKGRSSSGGGGWFQRRIKDKRSVESLYETRNSIDSGLSMNDNVSIGIAMEELNANLPLVSSSTGNADVLNRAMELVLEHLTTLVVALRRYGDATSSELVTTLQALQDTLICYWCLRLLQCILGVQTSNTAANVTTAGDQRAKMIQHFVQQKKLQHAIVDLLPASFAASNASSFVLHSSVIGTAFWMPDLDMEQDTASSSLSSSQFSILCTKEARVQNEINVVFYETLLTLHHALIHLRQAEKTQRAARDRSKYIAAANRQMRQKKSRGDNNGVDTDIANGDDDVPAAKQKDALARKLLEKYRFLMDSIVDVRLMSTAETSVALVQFVINHFTDKGYEHSSNQGAEDSEDDFYEARTRRLGALGSFLDDYRAVTERRTEMRSILFGPERTLELPLQALGDATDSESTNAMLERLLNPASESTNAALEKLLHPEISNRQGTVVSNGSMRIEYLNPSEPPSPHHQQEKAAQPQHSRDAYDSLAPTNNQDPEPSLPPSLKRLMGRTSPVHSVHSASDLHDHDDDDESDTFSPMLHSDPSPPTTARSPRSIRKAFQASVGVRRTAHECDACIGCNDVCTNERCFFCAEKEYQLHVAFAGSAVAAGPSVRQAAWQHRVPSNESSFNVEREYSSCEMRRHQSQRSCWIRVDESVYDVTDMLGVHPGGAQVLLDAAQHGGDCGPIMKTHPPAARDMLLQYRLGQYYECEKA